MPTHVPRASSVAGASPPAAEPKLPAFPPFDGDPADTGALLCAIPLLKKPPTQVAVQLLTTGRRDVWAVGWVNGIRACAWGAVNDGRRERAKPLFAAAADVLAAIREEVGR